MRSLIIIPYSINEETKMEKIAGKFEAEEEAERKEGNEGQKQRKWKLI